MSWSGISEGRSKPNRIKWLEFYPLLHRKMTQLKWTAAVVGVWLGILATHNAGLTSLPINGLAYAALAALTVAAIGRYTSDNGKNWHPAFSRIVVLLSCAALAGVDTGLSGLAGEAAQKLFFSALLGIALVILVARHAPTAWQRRWLGQDTQD